MYKHFLKANKWDETYKLKSSTKNNNKIIRMWNISWKRNYIREDKHWSVLRSFEEKKMFCLKTNKLSNIPHVYHHTPGMIRRNDTVEKRQDFFPRWNNIQDGKQSFKASVPSLRIASSIFMTYTIGRNIFWMNILVLMHLEFDDKFVKK